VSQSDWDRLQYYARKVKFFIVAIDDDTNDPSPQVHPSTYFRIAQRQSSALLPSLRHLHYNLSNTSISDYHIFFFQSPLLGSIEFIDIKGLEKTIVGPFLTTLPSQLLSRIVLRSGQLSVDILKRSIVHFKQLRTLELLDGVFMSDFALWEVLGTLPCLENLVLRAVDPASHPAHSQDLENSYGRSKDSDATYFDALESLRVTGSFFLIQHLLGFIDSPCLKSIEVYPVIDHVRNDHEPDSEDLFTPSMTIISSKWSQSLKNLFIGSGSKKIANNALARSKCLMLLADLHEMQTFHLKGWRMENMDDDVRCLVKSWPKLRTLKLPLNQTFISLSTLRIIADNCPELRHLQIRLDTSTVRPFDPSSKSLCHNLEVLTVGESDPGPVSTQTTLECQMQVTRHLDLIFPSLKCVKVQPQDVTWSGIRDLVYLCQEASLRRVK
jgi:hypothetical protein